MEVVDWIVSIDWTLLTLLYMLISICFYLGYLFARYIVYRTTEFPLYNGRTLILSPDEPIESREITFILPDMRNDVYLKLITYDDKELYLSYQDSKFVLSKQKHPFILHQHNYRYLLDQYRKVYQNIEDEEVFIASKELRNKPFVIISDDVYFELDPYHKGYALSRIYSIHGSYSNLRVHDTHIDINLSDNNHKLYPVAAFRLENNLGEFIIV